MGLYTNILGHEVKMNNLMAEAVRRVRKLEPGQYIANNSDHCVTFSREEVASIVYCMAGCLTGEQRNFCLGELMAWLQLSGEGHLTFG